MLCNKILQQDAQHTALEFDILHALCQLLNCVCKSSSTTFISSGMSVGQCTASRQSVTHLDFGPQPPQQRCRNV